MGDVFFLNFLKILYLTLLIYNFFFGNEPAVLEFFSRRVVTPWKPYDHT